MDYLASMVRSFLVSDEPEPQKRTEAAPEANNKPETACSQPDTEDYEGASELVEGEGHSSCEAEVESGENSPQSDVSLDTEGLDDHRTTPEQSTGEAESQTDSSSVGETNGEPDSDGLNYKQAYLRDHCRLLKAKKGDEIEMRTYIAHLEKTFENYAGTIRKFTVGMENLTSPEKVIMVVGPTGSGKTTLINGMFNYVMGIEWKDDFRLRLIQEDVKSQAHSITNCITAYTIYHYEGFSVPYTLTIIDTPGFGDTTGIARDREITEQIKTFFETTGADGIDRIDAIGFVTQSSMARLTPTQRYIFDSILSLYGTDIGDNICMLLTFADGQKPQVLDSIKAANLPHRNAFKFNNSALYVSNKSDSAEPLSFNLKFDQMFWAMGEQSFKIFMTELGKMESKSLVLTKEVLQERSRLEVSVETIQKQIKLGLGKLDQLAKEVQILRDHEADIDKNKNFTYTVSQHKVVTKKTEPGQYTTNCIQCNVTCHERCIYADDSEKAKCSAMDKKSGNCRQCIQSCHWTLHKNQPYVYVVEVEEVTKTSAELKKKYQDAAGKKLSSEQMVVLCADDFEATQIKILALTEETRKSIARLAEIALRPNPLSTVDYIDILLEGEKAEARPGWKQRVSQLNEVRGKAVYTNQLASEGFDPFEQYKKKIAEEKKEKKNGKWARVGKYLARAFGFRQ